MRERGVRAERHAHASAHEQRIGPTVPGSRDHDVTVGCDQRRDVVRDDEREVCVDDQHRRCCPSHGAINGIVESWCFVPPDLDPWQVVERVGGEDDDRQPGVLERFDDMLEELAC